MDDVKIKIEAEVLDHQDETSIDHNGQVDDDMASNSCIQDQLRNTEECQEFVMKQEWDFKSESASDDEGYMDKPDSNLNYIYPVQTENDPLKVEHDDEDDDKLLLDQNLGQHWMTREGDDDNTRSYGNEEEEEKNRRTRPPKVMCTICGILQANMKNHLWSIHKIKVFLCNTCGVALNTKTALKQHCQEVHQIGVPHPCQFCEKTFRLKTSLQQHLKLHQARIKFRCPFCEKQHRTKQGLLGHWLAEADQLCCVCGKMSMSQKQQAEKLLRTSYRTKSFRCPLCLETFRDRQSQSDHLKHHAGPCPPYKCPSKQCVKSFHKFADWRVHLSAHKEDTPYKCHLCRRDTSFTSLQGYTRHMQTHGQEKPGQQKSSIDVDHNDDVKKVIPTTCPMCSTCQKSILQYVENFAPLIRTPRTTTTTATSESEFILPGSLDNEEEEDQKYNSFDNNFSIQNITSLTATSFSSSQQLLQVKIEMD